MKAKKEIIKNLMLAKAAEELAMEYTTEEWQMLAMMLNRPYPITFEDKVKYAFDMLKQWERIYL